MVRATGAFLVAVLAVYVLAAGAATQSVLASLVEMGVQVSFADRIGATLHDQLGMVEIYLPLLAIAFAIALPIAALVCRWLPDWRRFGSVLAGFVAVIVLHLLMREVLGLTAIAATRSLIGLLVQGMAGAAGGYVYWLIRHRSKAAPS